MTDRACASAADAAAGPVTVSPAPHLPFLDPLQVKPPALSPLDPAEWVEIDAAYAPQMALRDRLLAGEPDRFAAVLREGADALEELTDLLAAHLAARGYVRRADRLRRLDGVEIDLTPTPVTLGRLSQEDWLILMPPDGTGEYRLVGGALVFPAGWSLGDKIGRPLTAVHAPVPGYAEGLAPRVNRIFAAAHPDRPLVRHNYSIGNDLLPADTPSAQHAPNSPPHLRVERQTIRRLPRTRAVIFGIKTILTSLADLTREARAALADVYAAYSPEMARYRDAGAFSQAEIRG